jgi:hypothetical protein
MNPEIIYNKGNSLVYIIRGWLPKTEDLMSVDNPPNDVVSREDAWNELLSLDMKQYEWNYFGKSGLRPRYEYACGDEGIDHHGYSNGKSKVPIHPWFDVALKCRDRIERESGIIFNAQLTNRYDDQTHHLLAHADKEALGRNNEVVTVSVGQSRRCRFSDTSKHFLFDVWLHDGDLLLMYGDVQKELLHEIPSEKFVCGRRYSMTFRLLKVQRLIIGPIVSFNPTVQIFNGLGDTHLGKISKKT